MVPNPIEDTRAEWRAWRASECPVVDGVRSLLEIPLALALVVRLFAQATMLPFLFGDPDPDDERVGTATAHLSLRARPAVHWPAQTFDDAFVLRAYAAVCAMVVYATFYPHVGGSAAGMALLRLNTAVVVLDPVVGAVDALWHRSTTDADTTQVTDA